MPHEPLIFLSAGEASGDHYGAELIAALRPVLPGARFTGLGGTAMEAQGQQRVVRAEDVAVMGITEIVRHIPRILRSYRRLVRSIQQQRPGVAVLIDFPDVNFRLAKHLKRMGVPVIWFVSPQLWAWKRRRLRWVQQRVSKMLTIFPFEEPFYAARGVQAEFVGHPLAEQSLTPVPRSGYAAQHSLDDTKPWIALLPGSRGGEIDSNLPEMLRAASLLGGAYEYLLPLAPTVSKARQLRMQDAVRPYGVHLVTDARMALTHSRAAAVASGTATVLAAVVGTPFVVVYRVSRLTFSAAKGLVRYPDEINAEPDEHDNLPIAMVNLIAGRRVVPELLQKQFTAEALVAKLKPLLTTSASKSVVEALCGEQRLSDTLVPSETPNNYVSPERRAQLAGLADVRRRLQSPTGQPGILRLRDAVLTALNLPVPAVSGANPSASNH